MRMMTFSIYRYNPDQDSKGEGQPYMQNFELDVEAITGKMLLNALEAIKDKDPTLGIRRSCGEGVCGSDGMNINGSNGLACVTQLAKLPKKVVLRPLPGMPVIRDLIVDMSQFYRQLERVEPYLQNDQAPPATERLQSPEERAKLDGLYECIMCGCCTSSCPSYWWNPEKFLGPQALLTAQRFVVDSRDTATSKRLEALKDPFSVMRCRSIMNCASACPKNLNPTAAISALRKEMLDDSV